MRSLQRQPVESTSIASVGYQADGGTLEIEFRNGAVYRYAEVPVEIFEQMLVAKSKGQYLHRFIRGLYGYERT